MYFTFKDTLFAIIAAPLYLLTQFISFAIYSQSYGLCIAMLFGTLLGLVAKYILDEKFVFKGKV